MPLPSKLRSNLTSVPNLEDSFAPPKLKASSDSGVPELSYSQFQFDKQADKIGQGGNAVVYRARIPSQDVTVALKQPFPNKTVREKTVQRILNEAETWAKVDDHPYIASILGWGYDAIPWVAIEYVDGRAITDHIEEFSILQRLWTAYAIVDAVAYANGQRGIVHHDLKPDNILLQTTSEGLYDVPKVVDWGLSRELIQHTGSVSQATPEYAAPEQFDALLPDTPVGVHTDVYQLGVVCYEILTGEHPDHLRGEVPSPSKVNSNLPTELDSIIMDSLAHDRSKRIEHSILLRDGLKRIIRESYNDKVVDDGYILEKKSKQTVQSPNKSKSEKSITISWTYHAGSTAPTVYEDTIFIGSKNNNVYAFDKYTGEKRWVYSTDGRVFSSPVVNNDTLFIGSNDEHIYALDVSSGDEKWAYQTNGAITASPTLGYARLYIGSSEGKLYALDSVTGEEIWNYQSDDSIRASPHVIPGSTVYLASGDGTIYALDASTGNEQWSYQPSDSPLTAPKFFDNMLYVGNFENILYGINSDIGELSWSYQARGQIKSPPRVYDSTLYFGSNDGGVYALSPGGKEKWTHKIDGSIRATPDLAKGSLYSGTNEGTIFALDANTGEKEWTLSGTLSNNLSSMDKFLTEPVVDEGMLFISSSLGDGNIYAISVE